MEKKVKTTEKNKEVEALQIEMKQSNILIRWTELAVAKDNGIYMSDSVRAQEEARRNQCCEVLAVGDKVLGIVPGNYVLMGGAGRLITLNGVVYGIIKEHMVDATFKTPPTIGRNEGASQGDITTEKTEGRIELLDFKANGK